MNMHTGHTECAEQHVGLTTAAGNIIKEEGKNRLRLWRGHLDGSTMWADKRTHAKARACMRARMPQHVHLQRGSGSKFKEEDYGAGQVGKCTRQEMWL